MGWPQSHTTASAQDEALKRNTDCVNFLASPRGCIKGNACEYRHSEHARQNLINCRYWLNGNCLNPGCSFRHPPRNGVLRTQAATAGGPSMPSTSATHAPYNSSKQAVPCISSQKELCLEVDRCAPNPTGIAKNTQERKISQGNVAKSVGGPEAKPAQKVEIAPQRNLFGNPDTGDKVGTQVPVTSQGIETPSFEQPLGRIEKDTQERKISQGNVAELVGGSEAKSTQSRMFRLLLRERLYKLKMNDNVNIEHLLDCFQELITQLSSIGDEANDELKTLLLVFSLPNSYKDFVTTLLNDTKTLKVDDVITGLLKNENFKKTGVQFEQSTSVARSHRGRSVSRGNNFGRDISRSSSMTRPDYSDKQCYYCNEIGHIKFYCRKMKADLKEFEKSKGKGKEKYENVATVKQEPCEDELLIVEEDKSTYGDCWFLDSACSNHVCSKKEWFDTYDAGGDKVVKLANGEYLTVVGKGTVKIRMHNGSVKTLGDVRYVPQLGRNLISLGRLDALGYGYSTRGGNMHIYKGSLVIMKGKKTCNNLYKLMGDTLIRKGNDSV